MREWVNRGTPIVIRRTDVKKVHDYARTHCKLRDYLMIRLPMQIGLRVSEISTLNIEDINFGDRSFQVLDSKKKQFYPLPLDTITLQLIKDLIGDRDEGVVFTREDTWKNARRNLPLSRQAVWYVLRNIGVAAGVEGFSPRLLRHFFACKWHEDMKKPDSKKTLEGLRRILRHTSLTTTTFYLERLVFFEDIQEEYQEVQEPYIARRQLSPFYRQWCSTCVVEPVCKIIDQACASEWASGCKHYMPKLNIKVNGR